MDFLSFLERIVDHIAWPTTILICIFLFRGKLGELVSRIVEVLLPGGGRVKLAPPGLQEDSPVLRPEKRGLEKTDSIPYYLRLGPDVEPYIQKVEDTVRADLATIPNAQRETVLIRNLVFAQFASWCESVYNSIFGGQLRFLRRALQAGENGLSYPELCENYEEVLKPGGWTQKDYSVTTFINILTNNSLIEERGDGLYRITALGRVFLDYLVRQGRSLEKVP